MKLITRFELASRSTPELHALYREIFNGVVSRLSDDPELRNRIASLENIRAELSLRT